MSSIHVSKRTTIPTGQPLMKSISRAHTRIIPKRIAVNYKQDNEPSKDSARSFDRVNQYNDIVKEDSSLTFRSLPPVKLSFKNSKTKFMKSPREDDNSSRILKPHLTLKTHSLGHHVFTEGISRDSEIPQPSFALQQLKVPYSNLPDNIRIYKERDRFAFGVKASREDVVSPYKLTPKPKGVHVIDVQARRSVGKLKGIQLDVKGVKNVTESPKKETDQSKQSEIKSNVVRLDPIPAESENSSDSSDTANRIVTMPAVGPLVPGDSLFMTENTKATINTDNTDKLKPPVREGRLSVVSIGDDVTANFLETNNRKVRQLYPIYDHKTKVKETYNKMKFKANFSDYPSNRKPKAIPEAFTYKISTRSVGYGNEAPSSNVKPIKNNLYSREKSGHYFDESTDTDRKMREYFEPKLKKYYSKYLRKGPYRPRSVDSDVSTTDMSHVPANPPPSEISHIQSEDMVMNYTEPRTDMLTVLEERTQTAELLSARRSVEIVDDKVVNESQVAALGPQLITINDGDSEPVIVGLHNLKTDRAMGKKAANDNDTLITDTDILMDKVNENAYLLPVKNSDDPGSVTDRYAPIAEASNQHAQLSTSDAELLQEIPSVDDLQTINEVDTLSTPTVLTDSQKQLTDRKLMTKVNPNKQFFPVPTVSFDKMSQHPLLPNIKERTSLSRTLQNTAVDEQKLCKHDRDVDSDSTDPDRLSLCIQDVKTTVPVTKLRLFSGSTIASTQAPSLNVTDDFRDEHLLVYKNCYGSEKEIDQETRKNIEKKLVSSSNIAFISPLKFEARAKRQ